MFFAVPLNSAMGLVSQVPKVGTPIPGNLSRSSDRMASGSEVRTGSGSWYSSEPLKVAREWVHDVLSGRRINVGDRMQMYDSVHKFP